MRVVLLLALVSLSGCAVPGASLVRTDVSLVAVGMSKDQVILNIGPPHEVVRYGDAEYFVYNFDHPYDGRFKVVESSYVRFIAGQVESYGRRAKFDPANDPTLNIRVKGGGPKPCDLYTELKKLEELRSSGVLTHDEFQTQKKKLLDRCE